MQSGYTGYVDRTEWWWAVVVSLTFIFVTFVPFLVIVSTNPITSDTQFMGAMHNFVDSAAHIARMQQGMEGDVLVDFLYNPIPTEPALITPIYTSLGQLERWIELSPTVLFHTVRIFAALFMFLTIYHLGASIWVKIRTRRIFFVLASISGGIGWLISFMMASDTIPFTGDLTIVDLSLPQLFPIYAGAANIHYPLAIACVALLASNIVPILRPGETHAPSAENEGSLVFFTSLVLALIYPSALLPLGIAYGLNVLINWYLKKSISMREWYWGLWIIVPALPIITYNFLSYNSNPTVSLWLEQRTSLAPNLMMIILGVLIPLIIAIPGILRALRRFEPDGDRFMLLWLGSMLITSQLPIPLKHYLLLGITLPIAYFATRSVEDFWFEHIRRRFRPRVFIAFVPVLVLSHLMWIFLPIFPLVVGWEGFSNVLLEQDYSDTLIYIDQRADSNDVVLAAPVTSLWIPAWTGARVVYGHPYETLNAESAKAELEAWYRETDPDAPICEDYLVAHRVSYVVLGLRERMLGPGACTENLTQVVTLNDNFIYATDRVEMP